jgi:hypothetical protein
VYDALKTFNAHEAREWYSEEVERKNEEILESLPKKTIYQLLEENNSNYTRRGTRANLGFPPMFSNTWYGPMDSVNGELEPSDFGVLFFTSPNNQTTLIWGTNIASSNDCNG